MENGGERGAGAGIRLHGEGSGQVGLGSKNPRAGAKRALSWALSSKKVGFLPSPQFQLWQ